MSDVVHRYLRDVLTGDTSAFAAPRARLKELRAELEAAPAPRYSALAAWRLLASNSLRAHHAPGRAAWDRANEVLGAALTAGAAPSFALASRLHAALETGDDAIRKEPIYAADERYLAPEDVESWLVALDEGITAARDGLEAAFRAYVGVVTIHPFVNGNGRTARLIADYALMAEGWLPLCFASPVASHVAQTYGGAARNPEMAFRVFAEGITNAYSAVAKP